MATFNFKHPCTIIISGPSGSGKTQLLLKILHHDLIQPSPVRTIFVFSEWQAGFEELRHDQHSAGRSIEFLHDEIPSLDKFSNDERNLLIIDDQMEKAKDSKVVEKFFTQGSHHRNLTVVLITQNLYPKGKAMRTASLNAMYTIIFRNPRDKSQVAKFAQLMLHRDYNWFIKAYEDAVSIGPFGYLIVDSHPKTPESLKVITQILPSQNLLVYQAPI